MEKLWDVDKTTSSESTGMLCPFFRKKCFGKDCQLWDRKQSDCGLKVPFVALGG